MVYNKNTQASRVGESKIAASGVKAGEAKQFKSTVGWSTVNKRSASPKPRATEESTVLGAFYQNNGKADYNQTGQSALGDKLIDKSMAGSRMTAIGQSGAPSLALGSKKSSTRKGAGNYFK